jgi:hypothetical protein
MSDKNRYDDIYEAGLGMDALIGRHLKNFADRVSAPPDMRQQILRMAQDQKIRIPFTLLMGAYFRALGRLLWIIVSLRWLEATGQDLRGIWIDDYVFDDYALTQWFYRRATMNSFIFGSGNFTLSG